MYGRLNNKAFDLLTKMLEKDPSNRISAENALAHPYFYPDMDIEMESKPLFKQSISSPSYYFKSWGVETLTCSGRKKDDKYSYFNVIPKEVQPINNS
jgi:serine/threonine protein kinase